GLRLVYFNATESYLVPHAARTFLNSLAFQQRVFGLDTTKPVTVLLVDFSDAGNASATVVPRNNLLVDISPLSYEFETLATNERLNTIMNHELVHIATMDPAARSDRLFRRLFGGKVNPLVDDPESILYFFLTTPRVAAPRWYHEGIAVFMDTWMAGGMGRAQSGYDEMVFRAMVRDNAPFYDPLGLVSEGTKIDFQLQINSYLYGARFMTWLARRYSPEKVVAWVSRRDGTRAYYASAFRQEFGLPLEAAWKTWIADERTFQEENLAAVRKYPLTPYRDITRRALGSVSRAYYDAERHRILAAFNYPGVVAHVGAINVQDGTLQRIVEIKGPVIYTVTSLAWDPGTRTLFYTTDNDAHRDLVSLNPDTGRTHLLQKDARIGDLAFDRADKSLWGIRHLNGLCSIVRIRPPYRQWERVVTWPYGTVVYDLDVSPDGKYLSASFGEVTGQQDVRVFETASLLQGGTTPTTRFDFGQSVPSGFVFSPDGRYLYGSSYYTGVSNIFRYDLEARAVSAVSNTDVGLFRPIPLKEDEVLAFRYSGAGFVPTAITAKPLEDVSAITFLGERLAEERPVVKSWNVGSPADVPFDSMPRTTGAYRIATSLRRESFYPIVQGYKDTGAVGMRFNFSDPVQLNHFNLAATWSPTGLPSDEQLHVNAAYVRYDWRGRVEWNKADFYDLFGPTKTSRKGYVVSVGHHNTLVFDEPRRLDLDVDLDAAGNLDRLPEYQNVAVDITRLYTLNARLSYADVRNSLGNVDDETGRRWTLVANANYADGSPVSRLYGTYDRGWALPAAHSSFWMRGTAGFSPRSRDEPLANFYFGGFGNNWVDRGNEKRYREYYSFPGAALNEIAGRNFVKSLIEWNLPPIRLQHAGTPGFYATWLRPALFAGGLVTNLDASDARAQAADVGGQLDVRFSALSTLDLTLSFGGAAAFENGRVRREAMVSLKILR
ncbi:MAG TPA: hypothetical protein VH458_24795, partial [Vicinamibacterales bacterium]